MFINCKDRDVPMLGLKKWTNDIHGDLFYQASQKVLTVAEVLVNASEQTSLLHNGHLFAEVVDERLHSRLIEGQLHPHIHLSDGHTLLKKSLLHSGMRYLFGNYSYSICLWGLKAGWLAGFVIFLCIVCTFLLNVYFGKFVITFIDIGEIVCMSKPKYHWMVIVVNLVKQTWIFAFFCIMLPVGRAHTPKNEVFGSQDFMLPSERACSN